MLSLCINLSTVSQAGINLSAGGHVAKRVHEHLLNQAGSGATTQSISQSFAPA